MSAAIPIRNAVAGDAPGIAHIYNDAVAHTTAIWNEQTVDAADRAAWTVGRQAAGLPVLIAAGPAGEVLGYASYGPWRAFDGYRHTVEHSVYVREDHRGQGIGASLLQVLIERARDAGMHAMVGAIEASNSGSIALHAKLGFVQVGVLPQVGEKFGRWLDLALLQLTLDGRPTP